MSPASDFPSSETRPLVVAEVVAETRTKEVETAAMVAVIPDESVTEAAYLVVVVMVMVVARLTEVVMEVVPRQAEVAHNTSDHDVAVAMHYE